MKNDLLRAPLVVMGILFCGTSIQAAEPATTPATSRLPVKEITVFKDGHCLVLHSGAMPVNDDGNVVLDYLPTPVLGTFWPFSADKNVKLSSTVSGERLINIERTALSLRELIQANIGAQIRVTEASAPGMPYDAIILSIPTRTIAELDRTGVPGTRAAADEPGNLVLLKTDAGAKTVAIDHIVDITFRGEHRPAWTHEEYRNVLTLKFAWPDGAKKNSADVGMMYVQKGIRWIPEYKVVIDGKGSAKLVLQATIINEMIDLQDVTANLVIGVPSFDFKDTLDPIASQQMQQTMARLSPYFQPNAQTGYAMSNAIMTQAGARMAEYRPAAAPDAQPQPMDLGPELQGLQKAEDLFVFTVNHITLKKGERMVVPVAEFTLSYIDVYSLDIPFAPPPDVRRQFDSSRQAEIVKLFNAPKVMHKIRLNNASQYPLTTAPALIMRDERVLGQGMMTYSPIGASCDLTLTAAVDIKVKKSDQETKRTPNAEHFEGNDFFRIDLKGRIELTNYSTKPVQIEVTRNILGNAESAESDGKIESINLFEDTDYFAPGEYPAWWGWYAWPYWWYHFNSVSRITWSAHLDPNQKAELKYSWYYYWR